MAPIRDLIGQKFGRLLVTKFAGRKNGKLMWACFCDCGEIHVACGDHLKQGYTKSCGCLNREMALAKQASAVAAARIALLTHGHAHAGKITPEYRSWSNMLSRCNNPKLRSYKDYGGRGITVCKRWHQFQPFLEDMGRRPEGTTLDRIDNNGNYEPTNCRWATMEQQSNNKRKESWSKNTSAAIKEHWKIRRERGDIGRRRA